MSEKEIIDRLLELAQKNPEFLGLVIQLTEARRETYKRIAARLDRDITGEIFQVQRGRKPGQTSVIAVGTDGVKNIVFDEMGFGPEDVLSLG